MKNTQNFQCVLTSLFLLVVSYSSAQAQTYRLTDPGHLPGQNPVTFPTAINQAGQFTGRSGNFAFRYNGVLENLGTLPGRVSSTGFAINNLGAVAGTSRSAVQRATLFQNGTTVDVGNLPTGGNNSFGRGINDANEVVGYNANSPTSPADLAFIWDASNGIRALPTLNANFGSARSINNSSLVTGQSKPPNVTFGNGHAYISDPATGVVRDLGVLDGDPNGTSFGNFINDNGHVVGFSTINGFDSRVHAFLFDGTTMRDLGALGGEGDLFRDRSTAFCLNNRDEVVGTTFRPDDGSSGAAFAIAFIYRDGQMFDLEMLVDESGAGYRLFSATGINDAGQIVVEANKVSVNESRAVLLTPNQVLRSAVSRKIHGTAGTFDIDLPLTGPPATECRSGANGHTLVFTFSNNLASGDAAVTAGSASISGSPTFNGNTMTVNLSNVSNAQTLIVTLDNVTDTFGQTMPPMNASMTVLLGDSTGNNSVTASDVSQTKANVGASFSQSNFRCDLNANGAINSSDVGIAKAASGGATQSFGKGE